MYSNWPSTLAFWANELRREWLEGFSCLFLCGEHVQGAESLLLMDLITEDKAGVSSVAVSDLGGMRHTRIFQIPPGSFLALKFQFNKRINRRLNQSSTIWYSFSSEQRK